MFIMSTLISSCPQDSLSLVHLCRASPDRYDFNPCPAQSPVTRRIINGRRRPYFNFAPPLQMESVHNNLWTCVFGRRMDGIRSTWACVFHVDVNLSFESVGYPPPPPGHLHIHTSIHLKPCTFGCCCRTMDLDNNPRNASYSHLCVLDCYGIYETCAAATGDSGGDDDDDSGDLCDNYFYLITRT